MPLKLFCDCALCTIESRLLSDLAIAKSAPINDLFSAFPHLQRYSTVSSLLSSLKESPVDTTSDDVLRELFVLRGVNAPFAESLIVLAFLPMLHRMIRLVVQQQAGLAAEDITQEALSSFLLYLRSNELAKRSSHIAFAISRAVKRKTFEWARRESARAAMLERCNDESLTAFLCEESFERLATLRHFLHRCITKGLLGEEEVDLLIQFKLDGNTGEELAALNGSTSNAVRQKFKRVLAKLRRLAR